MKWRWVLPMIGACSQRSPTPINANTNAPFAADANANANANALDASADVNEAADAKVIEHGERAFALPPVAECGDDLRCLIEHAYVADEKARALALALFDETGDVAGRDHESTMDGGFRGTLHIIAAFPINDTRVQLERVVAAARDFDAFSRVIWPSRPGHSIDDKYRWRDLTFRFFRSASGPRDHEVERTTPSAYAIGPRPMPQNANDDISFSLSYNVKGSLLTTEAGVRDTIVHEIFHMNDAQHNDWSVRALAADYAVILKKCGSTNVACLTPYAPNDTKVRSGTFYAFQQDNGLPVREYAAELALRWYKEHRALQRHEPLPTGKAFKCGPPENRRSWDAIVKEFFIVDLVPACP